MQAQPNSRPRRIQRHAKVPSFASRSPLKPLESYSLVALFWQRRLKPTDFLCPRKNLSSILFRFLRNLTVACILILLPQHCRLHNQMNDLLRCASIQEKGSSWSSCVFWTVIIVCCAQDICCVAAVFVQFWGQDVSDGFRRESSLCMLAL